MTRPNISETQITTPKLITSELTIGDVHSSAISNTSSGAPSDLLTRQAILDMCNGLISTTTYTKNTSVTLSKTECYNTLIDNYGQTAEMVLTLPQCEEGLKFLFVVSTAGHSIQLKTSSVDKYYLNNVASSLGASVSISSPTIGNTLMFTAFRTNTNIWNWLVYDPASGTSEQISTPTVDSSDSFINALIFGE